MLQGQALRWLILYMTIVKCIDSFEIFISTTKDGAVEQYASFRNTSYEIPLFQNRYVTIRAHADDFRRNKYHNSNAVGFKYQVRSTDPSIVGIQKETLTPTGINHSKTILLEDLYILSRKNALGHIFNAYPSPTLIHFNQTSSNNYTIDAVWLIESNRMGITNLTFHLDIFYADDSSSSHEWPLNILLTQPKRVVDKMFYILIPFIVVSISVLMGILLDPKCMVDIVKKPTPVIVGFVAQYGLMPFLAMAIAKIFKYTPLNSLALFVIGCCPGSGASNQWTVLFDGDVNLSAVMSFVSTATSFIMMPLYFYTIGTVYMDELAIKVPFWGLARSLALVVVPYTIGIVISHFSSKARLFVQKLIKPMMICLMVFFLTFGLIVNWYLFTMIDLYTLLTAPLLPFLGFLIGALLAKMTCRSWPHVKTIGLEAGMQNTGIAFMIIMYSFPQPYATQAMIVPLVVGLLTNKPLWIILIIRDRITKYKKAKELAKTSMIDGNLMLNEEGDNKKANGVENLQKL